MFQALDYKITAIYYKMAATDIKDKRERDKARDRLHQCNTLVLAYLVPPSSAAIVASDQCLIVLALLGQVVIQYTICDTLQTRRKRENVAK